MKGYPLKHGKVQAHEYAWYNSNWLRYYVDSRSPNLDLSFLLLTTPLSRGLTLALFARSDWQRRNNCRQREICISPMRNDTRRSSCHCLSAAAHSTFYREMLNVTRLDDRFLFFFILLAIFFFSAILFSFLFLHLTENRRVFAQMAMKRIFNKRRYDPILLTSPFLLLFQSLSFFAH